MVVEKGGVVSIFIVSDISVVYEVVEWEWRREEW